MIQLAKQEQLAQSQPFLKILVFSTLGGTLNITYFVNLAILNLHKRKVK